MKLISKSKFLKYLECPKNAWFLLHMPEEKAEELNEAFEVSYSTQKIMDQGNDVESYAAKLKVFEGYIEVKSKDLKDIKKEVDNLISKKVPAIYQPTFIADGFIMRSDFLVHNKKTDKWDLYEVKGSNSLKDDHITDSIFQVIVLEKYGIKVDKQFLVHLNNEYIRGEELEIEKLFIIEDIIEEVKEKKDEISEKMSKAKKYLNQETEPVEGCDCDLLTRSNHCDTFHLSHPEIPGYSVYDLNRITSTNLKYLLKNSILEIDEVGDEIVLTETQENQIWTYVNNKEIINKKEIQNILNVYSYPIYFFDYETFAPAVPIYEGFKTYQRIPIQFSLHYIEKEGGELKHLEYLHDNNSDPSETVAKLLIEYIDPRGTVLAWNYGFEKGVTKEIGERLPGYEKALNRICRQMKDLGDIFKDQHYVHKDFKGRWAIESIMNVLLPNMTYDHLPYTGQDVGFAWWTVITDNKMKDTEKKKISKLLLDYCEQDTFVMVEIWRILKEVIKE